MPSTKKEYDFIILGMGCAGLSLAVRMAANNYFTNKKVLLIDRAFKNTNDRTWCFWENKNGYFQSIVHHSWQGLWVKNKPENIKLKTGNYQYKMILGIDFYEYCFSILKQYKNFEILYADVKDFDALNGSVKVNEDEYFATQIFSSIMPPKPKLQQNEFYLLQHFMGWWVETDSDFFDDSQADLMNFNTPQNNGCTFMYVLPVSKRRALIEYTLFTENLLPKEAYNAALSSFLADELLLKNYKITDTEMGAIPMTNIKFEKQKGKVVFIGSAGGQTKGSSGYTFQFIQKHSDEIIKQLINDGTYAPKKMAKRFNFYDGVLLKVLAEKKMLGASVFTQMFKKNKADKLFKFLENETNFWEELKIMNNTKKTVFIPAAIGQFI